MEVAGGICRAARGQEPRLNKAKAEQVYSRWLAPLEQQIIEMVPYDTLLKEACSLAVTLGHPVADCLCLELARRWNIPLITADRDLWRNAFRKCGC